MISHALRGDTMEKVLIQTRDLSQRGASRAIVYAAGLMMMLAAAPAATAASSCKQSITACGCVMKKAKRFVLANDLTSSGGDCLTISKAKAVLDMSGHSLTGPGGA